MFGAAPPQSFPACRRLSLFVQGDPALLPSAMFDSINVGLTDPSGNTTIQVTTKSPIVITSILGPLNVTDVQDQGWDKNCVKKKTLPISIPKGAAPQPTSSGSGGSKFAIVGVGIAALAAVGGYFVWRKVRR